MNLLRFDGRRVKVKVKHLSELLGRAEASTSTLGRRGIIKFFSRNEHVYSLRLAAPATRERLVGSCIGTWRLLLCSVKAQTVELHSTAVYFSSLALIGLYFYYLRCRLAYGEGIVTLSRCVCVHHISLGGEGNALYPVLSSFL